MVDSVDSITSKRVPMVIGADMEDMRACIASDIPAKLEVQFNNLVLGGNPNTVTLNYSSGRSVEVRRSNEKEAFIAVDTTFTRGKFAGKTVIWSEHIADAFTRKALLQWAQDVLKREKALKITLPIMPTAGIFAVVNISTEDDYDNVFVMRNNNEDTFMESFVSETWTFQDLVVAYRDWFLAEYRNSEEFHIAYSEPEMEDRYKNSNEKLPLFVQKWYKAIFGQSLTMWEVMPHQDEIPF